MRSQVLIATLAVALGVQADVSNNDQLFPFGQQQQPQPLPPRPGQQSTQQLPPRPGQQPQPPPPRSGTPLSINQPQQPGGLLGNLINKQPNQPNQPNQPKQQGGPLGNLINKPAQQPTPPKQQGGGGLLGGFINKPANQPTPPKQPANPLAGLIGGLLGGAAPAPAGPVTHPIAIKQCPTTMPCRGRERACVPHPSQDGQFICVKVDDDCGGRRGKACPSGQACLADPRDRDACVNGWCNNNEGICVTPPGK